MYTKDRTVHNCAPLVHAETGSNTGSKRSSSPITGHFASLTFANQTLLFNSEKDFEIMTVVGEIYTYINRTSIMWELCRWQGLIYKYLFYLNTLWKCRRYYTVSEKCIALIFQMISYPTHKKLRYQYIIVIVDTMPYKIVENYEWDMRRRKNRS